MPLPRAPLLRKVRLEVRGARDCGRFRGDRPRDSRHLLARRRSALPRALLRLVCADDPPCARGSRLRRDARGGRVPPYRRRAREEGHAEDEGGAPELPLQPDWRDAFARRHGGDSRLLRKARYNSSRGRGLLGAQLRDRRRDGRDIRAKRDVAVFCCVSGIPRPRDFAERLFKVVGDDRLPSRLCVRTYRRHRRDDEDSPVRHNVRTDARAGGGSRGDGLRRQGC